MGHIIEFNEEILLATQTKWNDFIKNHSGIIPASDYEGRLLIAERFVKKQSGNYQTIYSVPEDSSSKVAEVILEITYTPFKPEDAWLKLLNVNPAPWYDPNIDCDVTKLPELLGDVIADVWSLTFKERPCNKLKIYGHEPMGRGFLYGVTTKLNSISNLSISFQGNWLIIDKKTIETT